MASANLNAAPPTFVSVLSNRTYFLRDAKGATTETVSDIVAGLGYFKRHKDTCVGWTLWVVGYDESGRLCQRKLAECKGLQWADGIKG